MNRLRKLVFSAGPRMAGARPLPMALTGAAALLLAAVWLTVSLLASLPPGAGVSLPGAGALHPAVSPQDAAALPLSDLPPAAGAAAQAADRPVSTFSIVAYDPITGDLGVAVESKFFAVGPVVPFAAAGVGAIATQSYANTTYGPRGLQGLRDGDDPQQVLDELLAADPGRDRRQVGIVDARGRTAAFTGKACLAWAGSRSGPNYTVQGNILAGPEVVDAMAAAFESTPGDLASRMVAALAAGQAAGGDARGRQSAALLVVREGGGYGGYDDRLIDLRVDDHARPIEELQRLLDIWHGQRAESEARHLLQSAAAGAGDAERAELLEQATARAEAATRLYPGSGWAWLTLAEVHLAAGNPADAATAGRRALRADPWIKTAVLSGIQGSARLIEALLQDEAFRSEWEAISSR